ncbi:hypothetical protein GH714_004648 [Hevea brasiliensis]|uniref:C2 domain-containing protein n=1 Tax=Hevea brasiliensis TaxID=3981 RepID=A0A6A6N6Z0_HEVBR|nr:hypothetical protein GH714_004648 [Hevea brasiliensis]
MAMIDSALDFLLPSWWEIKVTVAAAIFAIASYWFFAWTGGGGDTEGAGSDRSQILDNSGNSGDGIDDRDKMGQLKGDHQANSAYIIKLELLAAKNLIGANLNGTSDPYAIITCGSEKRFSSMVPGSRNPMWGEEFNFLLMSFLSRVMNGYARRRISSDKPGPTMVHQKPGPLQTIFNLPADEIVEHSYSCALERSFLYHGRMYVSAWHICFHSNVFSKQMKVIIPLGDIDEIRRSQHAFINPAITIVLRMGAGGHGVPPLGSPDGRVRYKFASFWNRNHALRALQRAAKNYHAMLEAEKKERAESALRAHSSSVRGSIKIPEDTVPKVENHQAFIKEEVLVGIYNGVFPCTAEQFFIILLNDDSKFTNDYRSTRKDTNLIIGQWHAADEYDGQVREITFRSLCNSPMCPPDTAMTEYQHSVLSPDKKMLVFETVQQAHDVPFGSYFEVHCRWIVETNGENSSTIDIRVVQERGGVDARNDAVVYQITLFRPRG